MGANEIGPTTTESLSMAGNMVVRPLTNKAKVVP